MPASQTASAQCKTFAISSGKGGVGKSSVALNLALSLAKMGAKVGLVDADTGLANINIMLGIQPKFTLANVISGDKDIHEVILKGPLGLNIIPSASGISEYAELNPKQLKTLAQAIQSLEAEFDYLLVDTAAGIHQGVCHFIRASHEALIVITPEPTSLTDSFSLIKTLKNQGHERTLRVLVNQCKDQEQAREVYLRLAGAVKKYLGSPIRYLGFLRSDEALRSAISLQRPVALYPSTDPSSRCFLRLAETLEKDSSELQANDHFSQYWQELLQQQIDSQAPDDELAEHGQPQSLARTPITSAVSKQLAAHHTGPALKPEIAPAIKKPEQLLSQAISLAVPQRQATQTTPQTKDKQPQLPQVKTQPALVAPNKVAIQNETIKLSGMTTSIDEHNKEDFEKQQNALIKLLQQRDKQQALHEFLTQL